ncbi:SDR family oxidoreductase [Amycolatopsis regifaucium]|uniref:Short-chain dehydrogenase n=1 Tax=Amycolatopsis regifaucium TaxID=546365 RepID=A0A154MM44_9PSEU|nr:SDR family oxidoreductase [Amycolatopsis regifaucium]KZB84419.1 short-chain dehydrogenase [Amycolatopsis regifaucium]OKA10882.1 short chain dehydrogenase [Amycolatopsis regifaucium]SFI20912.1 NAD(P)-dependent dehydrogenase, short-chain alcohol dehydrogenase family [Amycolatopsis regifaucium]
MALELRLDGAVVLVTGGVRGVGAGVTRTFLRAGAEVVTCARTEPERPVRTEDGASTFISCDVRDPKEVDALFEEILRRHGRLDVVVNNAGGAPYAQVADASPRFHEKVIGLNLLAPLTVARAANTIMQGQERGGVIVNISSVSGTRPSPGTASYGAAKAGLDNLTATLAVEWAPKVRVNALDVGMVRTEHTHLHYGDEAGIAAVSETVPLGRLAEPDEIGSCAVFLASPLASYVSGACLAVHGGGEVPAFLAASHARTEGKEPV